MLLRRLPQVCLALALCGALAPAASLAAPSAPLKADIAALHEGRAIVRYDPAKVSRPAFMRSLRAIGARAVVLRELPFAAVRGPRDALVRAASLPGVVAADMDSRQQLELHESAPLAFGSGEARDTAYHAGYDGRGVNVALVDSGTDGTHPDLAGRVVRNVKVVDTDADVGAGADVPADPQYVVCSNPCTTDTSGGHGTHVSGIMVGDGTASDGYHTGMAPGAGLVSLSVGDAVGIFYALQAYDYLLAHPELHVVAVNNSFGPSGGGLADARDPLFVATKRLHDAGIAVVFSAGNGGTGSGTDPEGASNCAPDASDTCKINPDGVVPWAISVANGRKDRAGGAGAQPLSFSSSRGDPVTRRSADGSLNVDYRPTLTAPGTNIWSARALNGVAGLTCGASAEPASCVPAKPEYAASYVAISGTSMAAPHVTGAIAVLQSAAKARLKRLLTPDEVKDALVRAAAPMTAKDGLWDFPCDTGPFAIGCGDKVAGTTGAAYEPWQVGAGQLDVGAAIAGLQRYVTPPHGPPCHKHSHHPPVCAK